MTTEQKIPVGVIGVGHLGSLHAKMYAAIEGAEFAGVYDADARKAADVASAYSVRAYSSAEELLREVRAVSVVTPTSLHHPIAKSAIGAGVHVFIEKPITTTVEEAREINAMAKERNVHVQVGHIERFNPALLALEKYNLRPMFVESHRLAQFNPRGTDVAVVLDLMIHDIDIILSLVKSPVAEIQANGVAVVSDTVDIANARLQFENGCVANVTASRISQKKMRKMRMFQRDAYISVDFSDGVAEVFRLTNPVDAAAAAGMFLGEIGSGAHARAIVYEQPEIKEVNALRYELELFLRSIREGIPPVVTAEEATQALDVAQRILEKIRQQRLPG